jgi:hypothetical protein
MNLETGSRGSEFGMSAVSCGNGKLRQWLIDQIDSGKYPGLVWENEEKSVFRIPWKHAGKQDYNREEDAALFKVSSIQGSLGRGGGGDGESESSECLWLPGKGLRGGLLQGGGQSIKHWTLLRQSPQEKGKRLQTLRGLHTQETRSQYCLCGGKNFQLQGHLWGTEVPFA